MAKKIKQFYFVGDDETTTKEKYVDGSIFEPYYPIYQIGIQTIPGVRFKLNNSNDYAYIGQSGVFELDLKGQVEINSLIFSKNSMALIDENESAYLIVDIVYDGKEE